MRSSLLVASSAALRSCLGFESIGWSSTKFQQFFHLIRGQKYFLPSACMTPHPKTTGLHLAQQRCLTLQSSVSSVLPLEEPAPHHSQCLQAATIADFREVAVHSVAVAACACAPNDVVETPDTAGRLSSILFKTGSAWLAHSLKPACKRSKVFTGVRSSHRANR
jgi:hypothetical protein